MGGALAQNGCKAVVVGVFVVLDGADPAEELVGTTIVDVSYGTTGQRRVVIEIAVQMNRMRSQVLQLHAGASPQLLSEGQVPLIEFLGRQMRAHGDRIHIGPGNTRYGRTCAGARSGAGKSQETVRLTVVGNRGGKRIVLRCQGIGIQLVGIPVDAKAATNNTGFRSAIGEAKPGRP